MFLLNTFAKNGVEKKKAIEWMKQALSKGVEYYHVDYATSSFTFYSASGATVIAPIMIENLPLIAADFDVAALKAAILDAVGAPFGFGCYVSLQYKKPSRRTALYLQT